jgi:hypothetical protein
MAVRLRVKEVAKEKGIGMGKLQRMSDVAYNTVRRIYKDPYYITCAGYLGHLFIKSESRASSIALISHLAFAKRHTGQVTREQTSQCSMNIHTPISSTKKRSNMFSSSVKEN